MRTPVGLQFERTTGERRSTERLTLRRLDRGGASLRFVATGTAGCQCLLRTRPPRAGDRAKLAARTPCSLLVRPRDV